MNRLSIIPSGFEGKIKIQKWFSITKIKLQEISASDEIDESQSRNLVHDLEHAYNAFNNII